MRVLLSSFGSAGDVRPILSVGSVLAGAGHEVLFLLDPAWCTVAESEYGLQAVRVGEAWDSSSIVRRPEWLDPKRGSVRMLTDLVIPRTAELVRMVRRVAVDFEPDAIVGHHISFGLPWVAEERGIPWVMCAVAPSSWASIDDPNLYPGMPDRDRYPRWTIRLGTAVAGRMIARAIDPPINAVRKDLGLKAQKNVMLDGQFSRSLNLGLWSRHFRAPVNDDPAGASIVGFPSTPVPSVLDSRLIEQVTDDRNEGERIAAWSLGTTAAHSGLDLASMFVVQAQDSGYRPLVLTGSEAAAEHMRELGAIAAAYAPHDLLFPLVDMVVHHAGIGTTAAALRAGIPAVVLPFTHDQPDNARRLRRMSLACSISADRRSKNRFQQALSAALDCAGSPEMQVRTKAFASRLSEEHFGTNVVKAVEGVI